MNGDSLSNGSDGPNGRSRTAAEVRADIARVREQLASTAEALRDEVALRVEWREWVRRRPALFVVSAFAVGFAIAYRR